MEKTFDIQLTAKQQEYLKTYLFENPDMSLRQALGQAIDAFLTDYFDNQQNDFFKKFFMKMEYLMLREKLVKIAL